MACYDRVSCSVDPTTGALTVNTKNGSCTIEPGDTVTFTETEVGYIISINGEPNIIPKPDEDDYGDNVSFTETDDSYIITINNEPNVIPKNCLQLIDCNGDYIDPCVDRVVTCENLQEVIDDLPEPPAQTQVVRGTGGRQSMQTLTARHFGTYPNETWRETWMQRNGDIVTIHSWNPIDNEWDSVAIEAPEDLVVLNNPVIYLRKDTGSANPPIETQDDLTVANAFNSFNAIRSFMNRTLVVGSVTIDARGDFAADASANSMGNVSAATFKNAQQIIVRGDPANATALVIPFGGSPGRSTGVLVTGSGQTTVRDLTFRCVNEAETSSTNFIAAVNAQGGNAVVAGTVRFDGFYDPDRPNAANQGLFVLRDVTGGSVIIDDGTEIIFDFDANTRLSSFSYVGPQAEFAIRGNVVFRILAGLELSRAVVDLSSSGLFRLVNSVGNPLAFEIVGGDRHVAPYSFRVAPLATVSSTGAYGNRAATLAYDFGADVSTGGAQAVALVDAIGVVDDVAGP